MIFLRLCRLLRHCVVTSGLDADDDHWDHQDECGYTFHPAVGRIDVVDDTPVDDNPVVVHMGRTECARDARCISALAPCFGTVAGKYPNIDKSAVVGEFHKFAVVESLYDLDKQPDAAANGLLHELRLVLLA